jgi:exodeoxyribonuclease V alpha subunit
MAENNSRETIEGKITNIYNQTESDWCRFRLEDKFGRAYTCVGVIPNLISNAKITLEGKTVNNQYGEQFKISKVVQYDSARLATAYSFLTNFCSNIGPKTTGLILDTFGNDTVKILLNDIDRLQEVHGIGKIRLQSVKDTLRANRDYLEIVSFFNGKITKNQAIKIMKKYGNKVIKELKTNPYIVCELDGFGFKTVDKLALSSGIKKDSIFRISAAIAYALEESCRGKGHTFLNVDELEDAAVEILAPIPTLSHAKPRSIVNCLADFENKRDDFIRQYKLDEDEINDLVECYLSRQSIRSLFPDGIQNAMKQETIINDDGRIYTRKLYQAEVGAAKILLNLLTQQSTAYIESKFIYQCIKDYERDETLQNPKRGSFHLTEEQIDAVNVSLMHRISIITGGPGRGKTAITKAIVRTWLKHGGKVLLMAPTGRAAQKIKESTGYEASTIHKGIYMHGDLREPLTIGSDKKPILVIIDEASMIDISLMYDLMQVVKNCNIVFVGDKDQIASVGPGNVLKDMIASGKIPCTFLTKGHRNTGSIAHNSQLINAGRPLDEYCYDSHFQYFEGSDKPTNTVSFGPDSYLYEHVPIRDMMIDDYIKQIKKYGIKEVIMCTAMRRGVIGVSVMNKLIQKKLTAHGDYLMRDDTKFYAGDRVMQTQNNYNFIKTYRKNSFNKTVLGLFNGDRGTVLSINKQGNSMTVEFDDGAIGIFTQNSETNDYNALELAYDTTVHKTQGSDAKCVIMGYVWGDYILLNRNLFYTGETRAKEEFRFYGSHRPYGRNPSMSAFDFAVMKNDDAKRNTYLKERLAA